MAWWRTICGCARLPCRENPVLLTRQDWRGPQASWTKSGLGYWEIDVRRPGRYEIALQRNDASEACEASVRVGQTGTARMAQARLSLELPAGPARLEAELRGGKGAAGPDYVHVCGAADRGAVAV